MPRIIPEVTQSHARAPRRRIATRGATSIYIAELNPARGARLADLLAKVDGAAEPHGGA
jgi:hypothetical protein